MGEICLAAKNCLKGMKKHGELWLKCEEESSAVVKSIANLLQQIRCCSKCDLQDTELLKVSPDVKEKLVLKIFKNLHPPISILGELMNRMRASCSRISECCSSFQIAIQKHESAVPLLELTQWTVDTIPIPLLLLAAESLKDSMEQTLLKRECFIESIEVLACGANVESEDNLLEEWASDCPVRDQLFELLYWCQFMT